MKIAEITVYGYELTYAHGEYVMSKGRGAQAQPSTVVRMRTDDGLEGWGETSTLAGNYLPSFTGGVRAAVGELAPLLIGQDPCNISVINRLMSSVLMGQQSAKSVLDIACWDILGKRAGLPISALLGGVTQERFPLYEAVPLRSPAEMADFVRAREAAGIKRFQLKVGNDPLDDAARTRAVVEAASPEVFIIADSNGGWTVQQGIVAVRAMEDLNVFIEQPCRETADCAIVQTMSRLPLVLDESVINAAELVRAKYEAKAGSVNLKIGRLGGIAATALMRNLAQELNMTFCIEDTWGGDIVSAAVSHVAASASPEHLMHASLFNDWTNEHVAGYQPRSANGFASAPTGPGLGIDVDAGALGKPLATFS